MTESTYTDDIIAVMRDTIAAQRNTIAAKDALIAELRLQFEAGAKTMALAKAVIEAERQRRTGLEAKLAETERLRANAVSYWVGQVNLLQARLDGAPLPEGM